MPTITVINGHAFGAGFFLALAHDYCLQNPNRGFMCLPEVDLGVLIPTSIAVMIKKSSRLLRHIVTQPLRAVVLEDQSPLRQALWTLWGALMRL